MSCLLWSKKPHFTASHVCSVQPPFNCRKSASSACRNIYFLDIFKHCWPCVFSSLLALFYINDSSSVYRWLFLDTAGALWLWHFLLRAACHVLDAGAEIYYSGLVLSHKTKMSKMEMQHWENSRIRTQICLIFFLGAVQKMIVCVCHLVCLLQVLFIYCNIYLLTFDLMGALRWCRLPCAIHGLKIANT